MRGEPEQPAVQWRAFQDGNTLGTAGSEAGVIIRDEEHPAGARITLERDGHTPFGITCGIYGRFMHTAFASKEGEAAKKYEAMKLRLDGLLLRDDVADDEAQRFCDDF